MRSGYSGRNGPSIAAAACSGGLGRGNYAPGSPVVGAQFNFNQRAAQVAVIPVYGIRVMVVPGAAGSRACYGNVGGWRGNGKYRRLVVYTAVIVIVHPNYGIGARCVGYGPSIAVAAGSRCA